MTLLRRTIIKLKALRHRLALSIFPPLREHQHLLDEISALKITIRRLEAELEISRGHLKAAREESQTSAITARQSMDRATQLTLANEQLQARIDHLVDSLADRLERAYGATANHYSLGGHAVRRAIFPWIEHDPGQPLATPDFSKPISKPSGRQAVQRQNEEFVRNLAASTGDPNLSKAADEAMASLQQKLDSGEYILNALGQAVPKVETINSNINSGVAG